MKTLIFLISYPVTEYFQMPEIYLYDDYEKCIALTVDRSAPVFCVVNTFLKSDFKSELYNYINEFSKIEKQHARHDKLQRGICVKDCLSLIEKLGENGEKLYVHKFPMDSKLTFDHIQYRFNDEDRLNLDHVLNICVNNQLMTNYNLSGYSTVDYCMRHDESIPKGFRHQASVKTHD